MRDWRTRRALIFLFKLAMECLEMIQILRVSLDPRADPPISSNLHTYIMSASFPSWHPAAYTE